MRETRKTHQWGWGFHVDLSGNLRDTFPAPEAHAEEKRETTPKAHTKWHVKRKWHKTLATAR
ncbi:MAG: hypothetical protein PHI98_11160 [Eubacteriales bacterium]|nr:hypothetical protein [Eubacteriales bacterium]